MITTILRRTVTGALAGLVIMFLALAAVSLGAPLLGHHAVIIRGASMEPALPRGSLAFVDPRAPLAPGSIVTVRRDNGVLVTHRVVRVENAEATLLELKGDANADADAAPVPAAQVLGTVSAYVPTVGYIAFLLQQPAGLLGILSMLGSLLLAVRLLADEPEAEETGLEGQAPVGPPSTHSRIGAMVLLLSLVVCGAWAADASVAAFTDLEHSESTISSAPTW